MKRLTAVLLRNMPIGRDFIKVTYYYVCTKCGDTKTEVETYDA